MLDILIPIILLFIFIFLNIPIGFALGISGAIGLILVDGLSSAFGVIQTTPFRSAASFLLTTIPMFVLMGELTTASGITKRIFSTASKWVGRLPGGLAITTVMSCAGIGAISGSSSATAAMMSKIAVPEMKKAGYEQRLALGTVSVAGTLAILIPPSIALIVYGILANESIGKLLIAGVLPGLILTGSYCIFLYFYALKNPDKAPRSTGYSIGEKMNSLKGIWPIIIISVLVLGGIYSGIVTAAEAAALGAFATLVTALLMRVKLKDIISALTETVRTSTMIFTIIIGAHIFGYFLTVSQVTQTMVSKISHLDVSRWLILAIILFILLILGFFMDQLAILTLTVPLAVPIITTLGFDPIWFGILVVIMAEIGLVSPPLGLNVFVVAGATNTSVEEGFLGVWRFLIITLLILLLIIIFPHLALWLPSLMK